MSAQKNFSDQWFGRCGIVEDKQAFQPSQPYKKVKIETLLIILDYDPWYEKSIQTNLGKNELQNPSFNHTIGTYRSELYIVIQLCKQM